MSEHFFEVLKRHTHCYAHCYLWLTCVNTPIAAQSLNLWEILRVILLDFSNDSLNNTTSPF